MEQPAEPLQWSLVVLRQWATVLRLEHLARHQLSQQQQALAQAVTAYAQHIDNPAVLMPVLERVAQKHVSLGIRKEHYAVVGRHLLAFVIDVRRDQHFAPRAVASAAMTWNSGSDSMLNVPTRDQSAATPGSLPW